MIILNVSDFDRGEELGFTSGQKSDSISLDWLKVWTVVRIELADIRWVVYYFFLKNEENKFVLTNPTRDSWGKGGMESFH